MSKSKNKQPPTADPAYEAKSLLIDREQPLNSVPSDQRAALATISKAHTKRITLPPRWREILAVVASQTTRAADMADALGVSERTFARIRRAQPEVDRVIAAANARLHQLLLDPVMQRARAGDYQCAQWLLKNLYPETYSDKAVGVAVQINNLAPPPAPPMTREDFMKLLAAAALPAIEHKPE